MDFKKLILKNRSYRRFRQSQSINMETLRQLVDLARLSASGANLQPLKYMLSWEPERNGIIFPHLRWAGYLKVWEGPVDGERPSAYIIILCDKDISASAGCDHGIAAQSILLGAAEQGLGGCMIGSIQRTELRKALDIAEQYEILLVLALGSPLEEIRLEEVKSDGDIIYWRDEKGTHHVPKRSLDDLIL